MIAALARGHALAYRALHRTDTRDADGDGRAVSVGVAQHIALFDAFTFWNPIDHAKAYFNDAVFNRAFLRATTTGELRFEAPGMAGVRGHVPEAESAMDFIGVNYYTRSVLSASGADWDAKGRGLPVTDMDWEIYPQGLTDLLCLLHRDYPGVPPIYITENGGAFKDQAIAHGRVQDDDRTAYLREHIAAVARAMQQGVPMAGYMVWSLMDNFEWASGYEKRFGIVHVDYATQRRTPKDSALAYRDFVLARRAARQA